MKNIKLFTRATILSAPLLFAFATQPVWADADAHDHHDLSRATLELNQGQKWAIDAPLRQGMNAIHGSVAGAIEQIHANQMSASGYPAGTPAQPCLTAGDVLPAACHCEYGCGQCGHSGSPMLRRYPEPKPAQSACRSAATTTVPESAQCCGTR